MSSRPNASASQAEPGLKKFGLLKIGRFGEHQFYRLTPCDTETKTSGAARWPSGRSAATTLDPLSNAFAALVGAFQCGIRLPEKPEASDQPRPSTRDIPQSPTEPNRAGIRSRTLSPLGVCSYWQQAVFRLAEHQ